jgi:hypothetical protein
MKKCKICGIEKSETAFPAKRYSLQCQQCYAKKQASYYQKNKEIYKKRNAEWAKKHPDRMCAFSKKCRDANKEKYREQNRKWFKENAGLANAKQAKRLSAKLKATPEWADLSAIKGVYIAASRKTRETGIPHEVDHIYPLQGKTVCGLHVDNNLRVLTASDNQRKKNKMPDEWQQEICPML